MDKKEELFNEFSRLFEDLYHYCEKLNVLTEKCNNVMILDKEGIYYLLIT